MQITHWRLNPDRTPVPTIPVRTRTTEKAPTLTTATAWRRALTGVGATMAAGSQECMGMRATLANPNRNIRVSARAAPEVI